MATYSIKEFKAKASEILRGLKEGEEVIITRRGKPCGRLTTIKQDAPPRSKPSLGTLRGSLTDLPDATYEDFLEVNRIWEPRDPMSGEGERFGSRWSGAVRA